MDAIFSRTAALYGENGLKNLQKAKVALFGLGGVGGTAYAALTRAGVGKLYVYDPDCFEESNLNRQLLSSKRNIGTPKAEAAALYAREVSAAEVVGRSVAVSPENVSEVPDADIFIDCVDDLKAKVAIAAEANRRGIPVFSSLGMANRYDPSLLKFVRLDKTENDPLARRFRQGLRKEGGDLKKVYCALSTETPIKRGDGILASAMPVPGAAGLLLAAKALDYLSGRKDA